MKKRQSSSSEENELRRLAELHLQEQVIEPTVERDALRSVHELRVHQIELEMQNEELLAARDEIEAGLKRYTDLYEFAPVGYFTLGRDGTITQVNLTGARLLEVERSSLTKRRFGQFVSAADRSAFSAFLDSVFEGNDQKACELSICRPEKPSASPNDSGQSSSYRRHG